MLWCTLKFISLGYGPRSGTASSQGRLIFIVDTAEQLCQIIPLYTCLGGISEKPKCLDFITLWMIQDIWDGTQTSIFLKYFTGDHATALTETLWFIGCLLWQGVKVSIAYKSKHDKVPISMEKRKKDKAGTDH